MRRSGGAWAAAAWPARGPRLVRRPGPGARPPGGLRAGPGGPHRIAVPRFKLWSRGAGPEYRRIMVAPGTPPPDSLPSAFRASDDDRENVIRILRDGSVAGRLSNDTFLKRVDRALRARRVDELA